MSNPTRIRIRLAHPRARMPERATAGATGLDLYACFDREFMTVGNVPEKIPTGVEVEPLDEVDIQVRPRSGLSSRGLMAVYGTIDPDYRGEIFVTMYSVVPQRVFRVNRGERVAQLVVSQPLTVEFAEFDELGQTERGRGGHGSTGR